MLLRGRLHHALCFGALIWAPVLYAQGVTASSKAPVVADEMGKTLKFQVSPLDRLSLYTDGVLEARSRTGELFGFERLTTLFGAGPTAAQAMEAAVAFGQEDDITVLTLTGLPAEEKSTA